MVESKKKLDKEKYDGRMRVLKWVAVSGLVFVVLACIVDIVASVLALFGAGLVLFALRARAGLVGGKKLEGWF